MEEAAAPTVNKETKIGMEFHIHNGDLEIRHHKTQSEVTTYTQFWSSSSLELLLKSIHTHTFI
jgi:hypothetical protein